MTQNNDSQSSKTVNDDELEIGDNSQKINYDNLLKSIRLTLIQ